MFYFTQIIMIIIKAGRRKLLNLRDMFMAETDGSIDICLSKSSNFTH